MKKEMTYLRPCLIPFELIRSCSGSLASGPPDPPDPEDGDDF